MRDHSKCKVVDLHSMVLTAHDFGGHITWRPRRVMGVVGRPDARDSHVCDSYVAIAFQEQVFRLDVPVDHPVTMHVLEAHNYASDKELGLLLREALPLVVMVSQVATRHQVCNEVDVFKVDKGVEHID